MRKIFGGTYWLVLICIITLFITSCSSVIDRVRDLGKPKTEESKPQETSQKKPPQKTEPQKPDVKPIIQKGIAQRKAGNYPGAIASFKEALKIDPDNAEAKSLLQETEKERDDLVDHHLKQGLKLSNDQDLQGAMREWDKVLELDPANEEAAKYKARTQKRLDALK